MISSYEIDFVPQNHDKFSSFRQLPTSDNPKQTKLIQKDKILFTEQQIIHCIHMTSNTAYMHFYDVS